jgi:hypothetical protein
VDGVAPAALGSPGPAATLPAELLRQRAAAALTRGYRWVEQARPAAPGVITLVPSLVAAVDLYTAGQYVDCLAQAGAVLQAIAALRTAHPGLPVL